MIYMDDKGIFLHSGTFWLQLYNPTMGQNYYFYIVSNKTDVVVWLNNCDLPMADFNELHSRCLKKKSIINLDKKLAKRESILKDIKNEMANKVS
jgi:hypothetical protein